jgi:hypothetical protein
MDHLAQHALQGRVRRVAALDAAPGVDALPLFQEPPGFPALDPFGVGTDDLPLIGFALVFRHRGFAGFAGFGIKNV